MGFTKLPTPIFNSEGEFTHRCDSCGRDRGFESLSCWIDPETGEFTEDDQWVIECGACLHTVLA